MLFRHKLYLTRTIYDRYWEEAYLMRAYDTYLHFFQSLCLPSYMIPGLELSWAQMEELSIIAR